MSQPTPAIVAQAAVRRLPRVALILLCAAYLMPGLVGRGPWKSADVAAFGYMAELARTTEGAARWFDPLLFGLRPETPALLPYWIGAWAIKLAPAWINPDLAVRFAFALMLWGTFTATWYAVYYLARTPRAQPVAFAFGGEARPTDYARAIADGALLALLATLGLLQLGHETTPALAQLFFTASLFYGIAALPYRPAGALAALALGGIGMALSGAPALALMLCMGCAVFLALDRKQGRTSSEDDRDTAGRPYPLYALVAVVVVAALGAGLAASYGLFRWHVVLPGAGEASLAKEIRSLVKLLLWFPWPAWPLAAWTLWRWRRQLTARHVILPLWFVLVPVAATITTDFSDRSLLLSLPAFATLAAFALPTFRRSVAALLDWLTLLTFTTSAIFIWLYWISLQTGIPPKPAANVARLAPGFVPSFSATAFVFALAATVAWFWLVRWRTGRHRAALWKTLVLPAGGTALCWMLVMTLWLPVLDYARSYAPQVQMISQRVGNTPCISELGLQRAQLAALAHHGHFELRPLTGGAHDCRWLLVNPDVIARLHNVIDLNLWRFDGTLRRPASDTDDLLLYQRIAP